ncbi:hypothetical protein D3C72_405580 [compost metagenome]
MPSRFIANLRKWFHRGARPPEPLRPPVPDWGKIDSYSDLCSAAWDCTWLSPDEFLEGPFRRYLEMCADFKTPIRARARIMEFGRSSLMQFAQHSETSNANHAPTIEDRAHAMAASWFASMPGGDYLLEVLEGVSNHNFRATKPDDPVGPNAPSDPSG